MNLHPPHGAVELGLGFGGIFSALAVTPYFFGGFNTIPQATAELENPADRRRIASILAGCILISLLFYCLVLAAVSMVLPRAQLLSYELPVAQAFRVAFRSNVLADLVLIGGLLGLIAVWNALFFAASRVLFALGRSRLMHPSFGIIGAGGAAPTRALAFVTALSILGLFFGKGVLLPVVNVTSTLFALMYAIVCFAVIRRRRKQRHGAGLDTASGGGEGEGEGEGEGGRGRYRVPGGPWLVWATGNWSAVLGLSDRAVAGAAAHGCGGPHSRGMVVAAGSGACRMGALGVHRRRAPQRIGERAAAHRDGRSGGLTPHPRAPGLRLLDVINIE